MGFDYLFGVDSVGCSGGLILLSNDNIALNIQNFSRRHINAVIASRGIWPEWKFTGFYGHPNTAKRKESWNYSDTSIPTNPIHGCV